MSDVTAAATFAWCSTEVDECTRLAVRACSQLGISSGVVTGLRSRGRVSFEIPASGFPVGSRCGRIPDRVSWIRHYDAGVRIGRRELPGGDEDGPEGLVRVRTVSTGMTDAFDLRERWTLFHDYASRCLLDYVECLVALGAVDPGSVRLRVSGHHLSLAEAQRMCSA